MYVLVFRHVPFEGAGLMHPILEARGVSIRYVDLYRGDSLPDVDAAAGLIFMGGPMSVNDGLPYLEREMDVARAAVSRRKPILGICLGAQLIAKALGARVHANPRKEIGWFDICLTEAGSGDAIFAGMNRRETVFHWHGETFDLPPGSVRLAYSDACENQAVRFQPGAYGLQFHMEVTPAMIADWCTQDENCGDVRELEAPLDPALHADRLSELSSLIFGRWCDVLVRATPTV